MLMLNIHSWTEIFLTGLSLQEFGFSRIIEFAEKFNRVAGQVYHHIKKATESFENTLLAGRGINIHDMLKKIQNIIINLPNTILNFPKMTKRILKVIDKYDQETLPPTVKKLEKLVDRVETLFKDISTDIMTVHDVSDNAEMFKKYFS